MNYWLSNGAPAEKIVLGIPFYGRSFTLDDPSNTKIGAAASSPGLAGPYTQQEGTLGYNEICEAFSKGGWSNYFDNEQRSAYMVKDNQWIGYEDVG